MTAMLREQAWNYAKKYMMREGEHPPVVIVNTEEKAYIIPVGMDPLWNEGADGRLQSQFLTGRVFGEDQCLGAKDIYSLLFLQEMWYLSVEDGEIIPGEWPSQSDRKREALVLVELVIDKKEMTQSCYLCDILRHGDCIDLGPEQIQDEVQGGLLLSFLAGVASTRYSNKELLEQINRFNEVGEF